MWYLPHLPLFYPGLEVPCVDLLESIRETIECDFWLDDIGVSYVHGKIDPPRCKRAMIKLESERIYFTVEVANGPVSWHFPHGHYVGLTTHADDHNQQPPNLDSVSPAVMSEISRILGWGPWGSNPRDRKRMRITRPSMLGNENRHG